MDYAVTLSKVDLNTNVDDAAITFLHMYSGPAIIRTPIVRKTCSPDENPRERISVTLFVLTSPEIRIPVPEIHFGNGTYFSLVNFPQ